MQSRQILFDDWAVREPGALERREKSYRVCMVCLAVATALGVVITALEPYAAVALFLLLLTLAAVYLEWRKVKYHHLVITAEGFTVTDRWGRNHTYAADPGRCRLELSKNYQRGGGIYLNVYDARGRKLFRYEDMINYAAGYQQPQTAWEQAIRGLSMPLTDKAQLLKN